VDALLPVAELTCMPYRERAEGVRRSLILLGTARPNGRSVVVVFEAAARRSAGTAAARSSGTSTPGPAPALEATGTALEDRAELP
jgi:hypothetical protein